MATKLKKGDKWSTKDRLWAVVNAETRDFAFESYPNREISIYPTREAANAMKNKHERVVRINGLSGRVL